MTFMIGAALLLTVLAVALFIRPRPPSPETLLKLAERGAEIREEMTRLALPTLFLVEAREPTSSRLGGVPHAPKGMSWPHSSDGHMAFLAQIDLAAARGAGGPDWLPATGSLLAFHDEGWGYPHQVRVILETTKDLAPLEPPADLRKSWRYRERPIDFVARTSTPSIDWLDISYGAINLDEPAWDELSILNEPPEPSAPAHRIGGYPNEIQSDQMAVSCEFMARGLRHDPREPAPPDILEAAQSWRLLLQLEYDADLGMKWADGGLLYVFVREQDARAGDFSQTVTISQTH